MSRLHLVPFGVALSSLFIISYVICILFNLVTGWGMIDIVMKMLPWASISLPGFLLGLVEAVAYGWFVAFIFVPIYNWILTTGSLQRT